MVTVNFMKLLCLSLLFIRLYADVPQAFEHLGAEIENERSYYIALLEHQRFSELRPEVEGYFQQVDRSFEIGKRLDVEIQSEEGENEAELQFSYLKSLRALQAPRETLSKHYFKEVSSAIEHNDREYFLFLIKEGKTLLDKNTKLKQEVLAYGKQSQDFSKNRVLKDLQEEKELDERSYAFMQKMQDEYKAYQEVLKKAEAIKLRQLLVAKKRGGVIVYAQENKGDIDFYMENLFEMHVSATLFIKDIQGYTSSSVLPYKLVLQAKEKVKVLALKNTDVNKHVGHFNSHISWAKGSIDAKPEKGFIYALPFRDTHRVSQGFNGQTSHKGNAKYAVDFAMDIGTEVYAARDGKVVEVVQRHNKHGLAMKMRQYANYIIIEHADKTLGRYFHLKQNSAKVKLSDEVKKGDLIGLSGNTGRTSGPHLHFVVTRAQALGDEYTSASVPIRFLCSDGVLEEPVKGASYCSK